MTPMAYAQLVLTLNGYWCRVVGHRVLTAQYLPTTPRTCTRCGWEADAHGQPLRLHRPRPEDV